MSEVSTVARMMMMMMMIFCDLECMDLSANAKDAEKHLQPLRWRQYISPKRRQQLPTILHDTKSHHHQSARKFDLTKYPQQLCARKLTVH
jgi:hypothetical protein